jgi:fusion and transport protein UGO1
MNAAYSIIKEEGGSSKDKQKLDKKRGANHFTNWSLRGLYHGFNMQCTSNVVLFVLHAINGIEGNVTF